MGMRKLVVVCLAVLLLGIMFSPITQAAALQECYSSEMQADNGVNPFDYSFFESAGEGKLELKNLKNLWGAGAEIIVYVNTSEGSDWVIIKFSGTQIQAALLNRKYTIFTEPLPSIKVGQPINKSIGMTIKDGALTLTIGTKSKTVDGINSFRGDLTTQSITGNIKAYRFEEKAD